MRRLLAILAVLALVSSAAADRTLPNGATSVITYFHLRGTDDGLGEDGLTVTDFDITYTEEQAAAVKADITAAHGAATDAWDDLEAYEMDATNAPGLYRIDWQNAAFDGGVGKVVILTVKCAGVFTESLRVQLSPSVDVDMVEGSDATTYIEGRTLAAADYFLYGSDDVAVVTLLNGLAANTVTATAIATDAIDAGAIKADAGTEIGTAVWATTTRALTDKAGFALSSSGLDLQTSWTTAITGNITGNLSGSVGSVSGAVGSVTGAVGSVAGNVDGNVTGSAGDLLKVSGSAAAANNVEIVFDTDFATNYDTTADTWTTDLDNVDGTLDVGEIGADAITAAKIANNAIGATEIADDALDKATFAADYWQAHTLLVHPGETVWYVSKDGRGADAGDGTAQDPELTIGAALADAASGDTIFVGPGTYTEQVDLATATKSITLRGAGMGKTIITQSAASATILLYDNCTILDLTVISTNANGVGIYSDTKDNQRIERVWAEGPYDGMQLNCDDRILIRDCVAKSTYDAINAHADYLIVENTVCFTDGSHSNVEARALTGNLTYWGLVTNCLLIADRPGTETGNVIGLKVGGYVVVRGTTIFARLSSAQQATHCYGVYDGAYTMTGLLEGCSIDTVNAGSGSALDLVSLSAQLGVVNTRYDPDKITGSVTHVPPMAAILEDTGTTLDDFLDTEVAAILADTTIIGAPVGASLSADIAAIKAETVLILADTDALQTWWVEDGRLDVILDASSLGSGAITFVYTVTSSVDASPIANVHVWVTSDVAGNTIIGSGYTDASGEVTFYLDADTYYFWRAKAGYSFVNPDEEAVS